MLCSLGRPLNVMYFYPLSVPLLLAGHSEVLQQKMMLAVADTVQSLATVLRQRQSSHTCFLCYVEIYRHKRAVSGKFVFKSLFCVVDSVGHPHCIMSFCAYKGNDSNSEPSTLLLEVQAESNRRAGTECAWLSWLVFAEPSYRMFYAPNIPLLGGYT